MVIERGTRIGDYEILDELGRGGMGRVYRVRNVISERTEAMKVLLPGVLASEELAARFLREIKVLASLNHPNIATLRTALSADGQVAMVMELVDGESLSKRVQRGPLAPGEAVAVTRQVLAALAYAHGMGVIHRDVKPANMMVTDAGEVKLTDFGIARSQTDHGLTATGTTAGSLSYMSPEQVNGGAIDHRSDIYSAGISLYEMVTGRTPFKGTSEFGLMAAHVSETPTPPIELRPDLPPALNAAILRAIAKSPDDRFASADEFGVALSAALVEPPAGVEGAVEGATVIRPGAVPAMAATTASHAGAGPPPARETIAPVMTPAPGREGSLARLAWLAAAVLLILAAAAVAGVYLRQDREPADEGTRSQTPAADVALPAADAPAAPPQVDDFDAAVAPPEAPAGPEDVAVPARSGRDGVRPDGAAVRSGGAPVRPDDAPVRPERATGPAQGAPRGSPVSTTAGAAQPGGAAADAPDREAVERALDQVLVRATSVDDSLDRLAREQARQGLGLRGDIAARQRAMQTSLARAEAAMAAGDAPAAQRHTDAALKDLEALEAFLGR